MFSKEEKTILAALSAAGRIVEDNFGREQKIFKKTSKVDYYTQTDLLAEEAILQILNKAFPGYNILAEESGFADRGSAKTFVIDPLDGTSNFYIGLPYFSVAIGLLEEEETIFSAVYNPMLKDLYWARKNHGAYKNKTRLQVSRVNRLDEANLSFVSGYSKMSELRFSGIKRIRSKDPRRIMDNWCPTLDHCLLAEGKLDCIICNDDDLYEPCIEKIFVREAGGIVVDFQGRAAKDRAKQFISINNKKLLNKVLALI